MRSTVALIMVLILGIPAAAQTLHKDKKLGFQLKIPKNWNKMPQLEREKWIVAHYKSKRTLRGKKNGGWHVPEMKVVVFPKAITEAENGSFGSNPPKDFMDYLKRNNAWGGGYYVSDEKKFKHRGMPATYMEIKFEKLTTPRRAIVWIIHEDEADWAIYFEGIEDYWKKLVPDFRRSLKSFKFIERTGSVLELHGGGTTGENEIVIDPGAEKKSPEEKRASREKSRTVRFSRAYDRAKESAKNGWRILESKNYVAVTHVDEKFTRKQLDRAEAIRKWLDKKLGFVSQSKAQRAIIRICKDGTEYNALATASRSSFTSNPVEIVTFKDVGGRQSWQSQRMNDQVVDIWMNDKGVRLWSMPAWFSGGISNMLSTAYVKSGKLVFKPDEWDQNSLRELARTDSLVAPRKMLQSTGQRFWKIEHSQAQAGAFMRFLTEGPKSKVKGFLKDYFEALDFVVEEEERREKKARENKKDEGEMSDEELEELEAARFKARKQAERKRIEAIFGVAFDGWSEKKWGKFERAYYEFVK